MDSTWAFCLTGSRDDVVRALADNLAAQVTGVAFEQVEDPQDFFPDVDAPPRAKREWAQVSYYVTARAPWTCFSYATGGEPFELHEPREVSRRAHAPVLELRVDELAGLRIHAWKDGKEQLAIDGAGRSTRLGKDLPEDQALAALQETFGRAAPPDLLAGLVSGIERAAAITSLLGITLPEDDLELFEPEDVYPEGHIVAFNRHA